MRPNHVIQRTIVELQLPTQDQAHNRQSAVSRLFQDALPRAMETVFSALVPSDKWLKIDSLTVDLGTIDELDFSERLFETRCVAALEQALKTAIQTQLTAQSVEDIFISQESAAIKAFIFFLKNGRLPWSFRIDLEENWLFETLTAVEKLPKTVVILRGVVLQNATRLTQQFPLTFLWVLLPKLFPKWDTTTLKIIAQQANDAAPPPFWKDFLQTLLQIQAHADATTINVLLQKVHADLTTANVTIFVKQVLIIKHLHAKKLKFGLTTAAKGPLSIKPENDATATENAEIQVAPDAFAKETNANKKRADATAKGPLSIATEIEAADDGVGAEAIYLNQAGLVILVPFIDLFFKRTQLVDNNAFIDETARAKAVHLLHYLATKNVGVGEYNLTLEKILCGVPLGMPIERDVILSKNERKTANNLLLSVIKHWTALGACSVDGLRETFLQRAAKLSVSDDGNWRLQVKRRTVDILMDRLPWGISMIKMAWMPQFIVVDW